MYDTTGYRYDVWTAAADATPRYEGTGFGNNYNAGFGDPDIISLTAKTYGMGQVPGAPMAPTGPSPFEMYNGSPGGGPFAVGARSFGLPGSWAGWLWLLVAAFLGYWFAGGKIPGFTSGRRRRRR